MALSRKQARPDRWPQTNPPIKYVTENGFSIIRLSEIDPLVIDTPKDCHFLVQDEDGAEREVRVGFTEQLITSLRIRRRVPLPESSPFWLVCAESFLARFLWEEDEWPTELTLITELTPDELMLALHWRDKDDDESG